MLWKAALFLWASHVFSQAGHDEFGWTELFDRWDAQHYRAIALDGYGAPGLAAEERRFLSHFPPLYPLLIRPFLSLGLHYDTAAAGVSLVSALLATLVLHRLALAELRDRGAALRAAVLFNLYPTAYFTSAPYAEGLYLLLTALTFHALRVRRDLWLGGACVALATLTRLIGVALVAPLAWASFAAWRAQPRRTRLRGLLGPLLLSGLGGVAYLALNLVYHDDPLFFLRNLAEEIYAIKPGALPFAFTLTGLLPLLDLSGWSDPVFMRHIGWNALFVAFAGTVTCVGAFRLPAPYTAYAAALLAIIASIDWAISNARYTLALLPMFLVLGQIRRRWLVALVAGSFAVGQLYFAARFVRGEWAF